MIKVYALSGKARHGKSTVANAAEKMLQTRHGHGRVHRLPFAKALKDDIRDMGFAEEYIRDKPLWMRELMQKYGQARRAVDEFHWLNKVTSRIQALAGGLFGHNEYVLVDDVRFLNEVSGLRSLAAHSPDDIQVTVIRVNRIEYSDDTPQDVSETQLDDFQDWNWVFNAQSNGVQKLIDSTRHMLQTEGDL